MNENIDLTEILKGCPKGTKFYSSIWGTVTFAGIVDNMNYPIRMKSYNKTNGESQTQGFTKDGRYCCPFDGECTLFPSKDQRDWLKFERFWDKPKVEKFDVNTLHPFDKILARDSDKQSWTCEFFSHIQTIYVNTLLSVSVFLINGVFHITKKPNILLVRKRIVQIIINGGRNSYEKV